MTRTTGISARQRELELLGQTVVVIGGSAGIGLETARRARAEGADVILTARNPDRLRHAADELGALGTAAFDAADPAALARFFHDLQEPIDHVMVTAGRPYYGLLEEMDFAQARRSLDEHFWLPFHRARGRRQGASRRVAAVRQRHRRPSPGRRPRGDLGRHRRDARADRQPGP
jgi:NAD(P)-dependent dehydrogenase (short-subunit alcohol dehydrogenase family)